MKEGQFTRWATVSQAWLFAGLLLGALVFGVAEARDAWAQSRCYSNSECGGGVCRSGVCTTANGACYSDSDCAEGVCRSGQCTVAVP